MKAHKHTSLTAESTVLISWCLHGGYCTAQVGQAADSGGEAVAGSVCVCVDSSDRLAQLASCCIHTWKALNRLTSMTRPNLLNKPRTSSSLADRRTLAKKSCTSKAERKAQAAVCTDTHTEQLLSLVHSAAACWDHPVPFSRPDVLHPCKQPMQKCWSSCQQCQLCWLCHTATHTHTYRCHDPPSCFLHCCPPPPVAS